MTTLDGSHPASPQMGQHRASLNRIGVATNILADTSYGPSLTHLLNHADIDGLNTVRIGGTFPCYMSRPHPRVAMRKQQLPWIPMRVYPTPDWLQLTFAWGASLFRANAKLSSGSVLVNMASVLEIEVLGCDNEGQGAADIEAAAGEAAAEEAKRSEKPSLVIHHRGVDTLDYCSVICFKDSSQCELWATTLEGMVQHARRREGLVGRFRFLVRMPNTPFPEEGPREHWISLVKFTLWNKRSTMKLPIAGHATMEFGVTGTGSETGLLVDCPVDTTDFDRVEGVVNLAIPSPYSQTLYFSLDCSGKNVVAGWSGIVNYSGSASPNPVASNDLEMKDIFPPGSNPPDSGAAGAAESEQGQASVPNSTQGDSGAVVFWFLTPGGQEKSIASKSHPYAPTVISMDHSTGTSPVVDLDDVVDKGSEADGVEGPGKGKGKGKWKGKGKDNDPTVGGLDPAELETVPL